MNRRRIWSGHAACVGTRIASAALALVRLAGVPILAAAALDSYLDVLWSHGLSDVYPPEVQIADCLSRLDALASTIIYSGVAPEAVDHVGAPGVIGASSACVFVVVAVRRAAADGGAPGPVLAYGIVQRTARFAARLSLFLLTYTLLAQPQFRPPGVQSAVPAALVVTTVITVLAYMVMIEPALVSWGWVVVRRSVAVACPAHRRPRMRIRDRCTSLEQPGGDSFRSAASAFIRAPTRVPMTVSTILPGAAGDGRGSRNIYVASSWRNQLQQRVVQLLRSHGHRVYDFKHPANNGARGFHWEDVDLAHSNPVDGDPWAADVSGSADYVAALDHPVAVEGYERDFAAMLAADTFVLVLPCGRSAHLELGGLSAPGNVRRSCWMIRAPRS